MTRRLLSTGSPMEAQAAYSRAVVQGDWCFVAGTTGYDYAAMVMPEDAGAQARNTFATIARTLDQAGFAMADVVRAVYYVTDVAYADALFEAAREVFADVRPAATLVVAGLLKPEIKVEIEVTALKRR